MDKGTQIVEYFCKFMDPSLDFPNFFFTFLDQRLLVCKFMRRKLGLEDLCLALLRRMNVFIVLSGIEDALLAKCDPTARKDEGRQTLCADGRRQRQV